MAKSFVESRIFTARVEEYLDDDGYSALQEALLANPDLGDVIPGCRGLRKLRFADPRRAKGKRGALRVIYLHIAEADRIELLTIYAKGEKKDLTTEDKKILRILADEARGEAKGKVK